MSRTATQRAAAREKKRRQRAKARERARIAAEALAALQERRDEELAPQVLREPVFTHGGAMLVGARVAIVNGRPVRALELETLMSMNKAVFGDRHKRAARQLQMDWSDVGGGLNVAAVDYLRVGGGGGGMGGHIAMLEQIATRKRLDAALAFLGAFAPGVCRVVLDSIPVAIWASEQGMEMMAALQWLQLGLSRLALFYWPPKEKDPATAPLLVFGPARSAYSTEMEGGEETVPTVAGS